MNRGIVTILRGPGQSKTGCGSKLGKSQDISQDFEAMGEGQVDGGTAVFPKNFSIPSIMDEPK